MKLLEHEAKDILKRMGLRVPYGANCEDLSELESIMTEIGFPSVLKGQVLVGGRGKAGAVSQVNSPDDARNSFKNVIGMDVNGHKVGSVLFEAFIDHLEEWYLAITIDYAEGVPSLIFCRKGGIDIESVPRDELVRISLDPLGHIPEQDIRRSLILTGMEQEHLDGLIWTMQKIWAGFRNNDCELIEINPLMLVADGSLIAADAKIILNDDGLFRHPELIFDPDRERTAFEISCRKIGLTGVQLNGEVGVLANGAGLTMAILDKLTEFDLEGGAFLDMGGSDDPEKIRKAVDLISDGTLLPHLKGIVICVFGGITKCDTVAQGILEYYNQDLPELPIAIRLRGVNEDIARKMLAENGFESYSDINSMCISIKKHLER